MDDYPKTSNIGTLGEHPAVCESCQFPGDSGEIIRPRRRKTRELGAMRSETEYTAKINRCNQ